MRATVRAARSLTPYSLRRANARGWPNLIDPTRSRSRIPGDDADAAQPRPADDERLVAALAAGDERTFQELFRGKYPLMKRIARGYVDSDATAEEVVQETWLAVLSGIGRFEGRSSLNSWIFSILVNQARKRGVREHRTVPLSSLEPSGEERSVDADRFQSDDDAWPGHWATPPRPWQRPERRLLSLEARGHLRQALAQLPERYRTVVALRDVEGCSADEVCQMLELSQENQRVLLHRGRSRLRAALDAYIGEAP
jgi:RNA polymerase sigma-70 factor, ECF subfamily